MADRLIAGVFSIRQRIENSTMARFLFPSSFECDCGHQSDFFESSIREMSAMSRRKKAVRIGDSEENEHFIVFRKGQAAEVVCPQLGPCPITGWD